MIATAFDTLSWPGAFAIAALAAAAAYTLGQMFKNMP